MSPRRGTRMRCLAARTEADVQPPLPAFVGLALTKSDVKRTLFPLLPRLTRARIAVVLASA